MSGLFQALLGQAAELLEPRLNERKQELSLVNVDAVAPSLEPTSVPPMREFVAAYGSVATEEVAEVYGLSPGKARQALESLVDDGSVRRERRGNGYFWYAPREGDR